MSRREMRNNGGFKKWSRRVEAELARKAKWAEFFQWLGIA